LHDFIVLSFLVSLLPNLRQFNHNGIGSYSLTLQGVKGKAFPLQAWAGPKGSRRLRLPDWKTVGTWRW